MRAPHLLRTAAAGLLISAGVGVAQPPPPRALSPLERAEANRRIAFVLQGPPPQVELGGAGGEARLEGSPEPAAAAAGTEPEGGDAAPVADAGTTPEAAGTIPDLAEDTSPSVAPVEKTIRPLPRPEGLKAGDNQ